MKKNNDPSATNNEPAKEQRRSLRRVPPSDDRDAAAALDEATQRYVDLYEFAPIAYVSFDRTGRIEEVNLAAVNLFGRHRNAMLGCPFAVFVAREDAQLFLNHLLRCRANEARVETELRLKQSQYELVPVHLTSTPMTSSMRQGAMLYQTAIVDLSERKRAEEKVRQTQERFELLVEGAKEYAMFLLDPDNKITFWSSGAERVFGWSAKEATGKSGSLIFTPEDRERGAVEKEIGIASREGRAPDRRWHLRKDGTRIWVDGVMERLDDERGNLRGFAKIARDATDQRKADEQLRYARDQLEQRVLERTADLMSMNNELERTIRQREQLERDLLEISERERRRIGQDLHDIVCQELTATALFLKSASNTIHHREAAKSLSEAAEIVNRNVGVARDLARSFQPSELRAGGLIEALRGLCKQANEHPKIHCTLKLPKNIRVRDETLALNIYRIAQEAVRNAVNHSGGDEVIICIEREKEFVRLVVEDNGKGFRPPKGKKRSKGLGLHIMKYRANVLGGTLMIDARPKGGTKVTCEVPIKTKRRMKKRPS
jgi:PAS domain S-box-containing protein